MFLKNEVRRDTPMTSLNLQKMFIYCYLSPATFLSQLRPPFSTESFQLPLPGYGASQLALVRKNPLANAEDRREAGSVPESGRSLDVGNGNPGRYSCPENSTDRGDWCATVHETARSRTQLSD